jgi:hypothetical protein
MSFKKPKDFSIFTISHGLLTFGPCLALGVTEERGTKHESSKWDWRLEEKFEHFSGAFDL